MWAIPAWFVGTPTLVHRHTQLGLWAIPPWIMGTTGLVRGLSQLGSWANSARFAGTPSLVRGHTQLGLWAFPAWFVGKPSLVRGQTQLGSWAHPPWIMGNPSSEPLRLGSCASWVRPSCSTQRSRESIHREMLLSPATGDSETLFSPQLLRDMLVLPRQLATA